jgi:hypothetical protein
LKCIKISSKYIAILSNTIEIYIGIPSTYSKILSYIFEHFEMILGPFLSTIVALAPYYWMDSKHKKLNHKIDPHLETTKFFVKGYI